MRRWQKQALKLAHRVSSCKTVFSYSQNSRFICYLKQLDWHLKLSTICVKACSPKFIHLRIYPSKILCPITISPLFPGTAFGSQPTGIPRNDLAIGTPSCNGCRIPSRSIVRCELLLPLSTHCCRLPCLRSRPFRSFERPGTGNKVRRWGASWFRSCWKVWAGYSWLMGHQGGWSRITFLLRKLYWELVYIGSRVKVGAGGSSAQESGTYICGDKL